MSLRSVAICIIGQEGKVRFERSVPSDAPDLVRCLQRVWRTDSPGGIGSWYSDPASHLLNEAGFDVVCMEARQVNAALSAMRNKTDKHDARGIAQIGERHGILC
ncbi:IS110 family transposase [Rhizobium mesoamericanum]|uniref:IS110 family transposase n=1 Tax=Rhizobium mesoamericanum TaxID=1079800 RepID=UPI003520AC37